MRRRERAQRATRICANRRAVIGSARRTSWQAARGIHFDIGREVIGEVNGVAGGFMLLQRNLLYTAITRAKRLCILIGQPKAIAMAVKNNKSVTRKTLLKEFLTTELACR